MSGLKEFSSLMELLIAVECDSYNKVFFNHKQDKINIHDNDIKIRESISISKEDYFLGSIDYMFNGLEPEVNIGSINSSHKRIGSYLMISTLLFNSAYKPITSRIQFFGFNNHRRGDVDSMNYELNHWGNGVFGGKPSQLLHLNYGFKFKFIDFNDELTNKLFNSLDTFDSSADLSSNNNDDDSYLSKLITVFMSNWFCDKSLLIYDSISNAYDSLIKLINNYFIKVHSKSESFNSISKKMIILEQNKVKNVFLNNYKVIYNNALSNVKSLRFKLKQELKINYELFVSFFKKRLLSFINPFNKSVYDSYISNFMNSRGLKELRFLIDAFNPDRATIPLPNPNKIEENFDLMVHYFNNYIK